MGSLNKELKKVLEYIAKKEAKKKLKKKKAQKKPKKASKKEKLWMELYQRSLMSGSSSGGGAVMSAPLRVTNYDTEKVKSEMADLKEKMADEKKKSKEELKRFQDGLEQYKKQLELEYEQKVNPRQGFIADDGNMFRMEDFNDAYDAVQSQITNLTNELDVIKTQKQIAKDSNDEKKVEALQVQEEQVKKKKSLSQDQLNKMAEGRKRAQEERQRQMEIIQAQAEMDQEDLESHGERSIRKMKREKAKKASQPSTSGAENIMKYFSSPATWDKSYIHTPFNEDDDE